MRSVGKIFHMTTLIMIDGQGGLTRDAAISKRFKKELVELGLSANQAAKIIGVGQPWLSRRITGEVPWAAGDVDRVCEPLGVDADFVLTGIRALPTGPDGGGAAGAPTRRPTYDLRIKSP